MIIQKLKNKDTSSKTKWAKLSCLLLTEGEETKTKYFSPRMFANLHLSFDCQMLALFSNVVPFKVHSWVEEISDTYSVVNEDVDCVGSEGVGFVGSEGVGTVGSEGVGTVDDEAVVVSLEQHSDNL